MKLKIDKEGCLWVERAGEMKEQFCHFTGGGHGMIYCGDECPLFDEPVKIATRNDGRTQIWGIQICQGRAITGELTDERGDV